MFYFKIAFFHFCISLTVMVFIFCQSYFRAAPVVIFHCRAVVPAHVHRSLSVGVCVVPQTCLVPKTVCWLSIQSFFQDLAHLILACLGEDCFRSHDHENQVWFNAKLVVSDGCSHLWFFSFLLFYCISRYWDMKISCQLYFIEVEISWVCMISYIKGYS